MASQREEINSRNYAEVQMIPQHLIDPAGQDNHMLNNHEVMDDCELHGKYLSHPDGCPECELIEDEISSLNERYNSLMHDTFETTTALLALGYETKEGI